MLSTLLLIIIVVQLMIQPKLRNYNALGICFIFFFNIIISLVLIKTGFSGVKIATLYAILALLIIGILDAGSRIHLVNNLLFWLLVAYILNIFISNFCLFDQWSRTRISEVQIFHITLLFEVLIPLFILNFFFSNISTIKSTFYLLPVIGILFYVMAFIIIDFGAIDMNDRLSIERLAKDALNSITISRFSLIIFTTSFMIILNKFTYNKIILLFIILFSLFVLFLSGQRGTILGCMLSLIVYFIYNIKRGNIYRLIPFFILIAFAGLMVFSLNIFGLADRFTDLKDYESLERFYDYERSFDIFMKNNFMFPEGTFGYVYLTDRCYPHNIILESMVEYGLVGLILIILIYTLGARYSYLIIKSKISYVQKIPAVIWIGLGFSALVSSDVIGNYPFLFFTATISTIYQLNHDREKSIMSQINYSKKNE